MSTHMTKKNTEEKKKKKETILVALFRQLSIFLNFYYTQGSVLESEKDISILKKKKKKTSKCLQSSRGKTK